MKIFDKAKQLTDNIVEKATEFSSDEILADTIIKAVEKQEKVNNILQRKEANYRVSNLELSMGIPPTVTFGICRVDKKHESTDDESEHQLEL